MIKNSKIWILTTIFISVVCLLGCSDNLQTEITYLQETAPQNLKAVAYEGVNVITWDFMADNHYGIEISRTGSDGSYVVLASELDKTTTNYIDKVSFTNKLENDITYTYTVTSLGGMQKNRITYIVNDLSTTSSASSSVTVVAKIPEQGTQISKYIEEVETSEDDVTPTEREAQEGDETPTDGATEETIPVANKISAKIIKNAYGNELVFVKVPASYLYTTKITFTEKTTGIKMDETSIYPSTVTTNNIFTTFAFPYTGADIILSAQKVYYIDSIPYYEPSEAFTKTLTGSKKSLISAPALNAYSLNDAIELHWVNINEPVTYALYRIVYNTNLGYVEGGYKEIPIPTDAKVSEYNGTTYQNGYYIVHDTTAQAGVTYKYVLVQKDEKGNLTSSKSININLTESVGNVTLNATQIAGTKNVRLAWVASSNATGYKLYRYDPSDPCIKHEITIPEPSDFVISNYYYTIDTGLEIGNTYKYTLYAVNNDLLGNGSTKEVTIKMVTATSDELHLTTAQADNSQAINISWTGVQYATSYKLYRISTNEFIEIPVPTASNSSFYPYGFYWLTDTNVEVGNNYLYLLNVITDNVIEVLAQDETRVTPSLTDFTCSFKDPNYYLTWTGTKDASYEVYYTVFDNMGFESEKTPITHSTNGEGRFFAKTVFSTNPDTKITGCGYAFYVDLVNSKGDVLDSDEKFVSFNPKNTTYAYVLSSPSIIRETNSITITVNGYNLDKYSIKYRTDTTDWIDKGTFGTGSLDSEESYKYSKQIDLTNLGNVPVHITIFGDGENNYNGTDYSRNITVEVNQL